MTQISAWDENLILAVHEIMYCMRSPSIPPKRQALTTEEAKSLINRISPAGKRFKQIVQNLAMEAGVSNLLGLQLRRLMFSMMKPPLDVSSPLSWMMPLLSRKPLHFRTNCLGRPMRNQENSSLWWTFATTMLQPGLLGEITGSEPHEIQLFSLCICKAFYEETKALLPKPKNLNAIKEDKKQRYILIENLMTIYFLTSYHTVQARYINDSVTIMLQLASEPDNVTARTEWAESFERIALCLELLWYSEKYYPAVGIVFRSKLYPMHAFRHGNAFARMTPLLFYIQFYNRHLNDALKKEGWDHLRDYTRYWLDKLGVGCKDYDFLLTKMFNLNTLCRIDGNLKQEDDGEVRPSVVEHMEKLRDETFQVLVVEPFTLEISRTFLSTLFEYHLGHFDQVLQPVTHTEERERVFLVATATLHTMENLIARNFAHSGHKGSRKSLTRAPKEVRDDTYSCHCHEMLRDVPETVKCFQDILKFETIVSLTIDKDVTHKNRVAVDSAKKLLGLRRQQRGLGGNIFDHNLRIIKRKREELVAAGKWTI